VKTQTPNTRHHDQKKLSKRETFGWLSFQQNGDLVPIYKASYRLPGAMVDGNPHAHWRIIACKRIATGN
jgi:hypothetical protein